MKLYERGEEKLKKRYSEGDAIEKQAILEIMDTLGDGKLNISDALKKIILGTKTEFNGTVAREAREEAGYVNGRDFVRELFPDKVDTGNEYALIMKYESGSATPSNPPRGVASKAYLYWHIDNTGYNPYGLRPITSQQPSRNLTE